MNELSLFTGAGGGLLGTHHLLGFHCIGYVEWDDYCQRVIAARIRDGYLPAAPIFGDVREFAQSGAAEQYRGFADVVTAGFPCQPFSVAGKQLAADDPRNMWPATRDVIRIVRPRSVLLENVPGLLTCGYAGVVLSDLAAMGYVGRWGCISAAAYGAPHRRNRWWVVAHAEHAERWPQCGTHNGLAQRPHGIPQRQEGSGGFEPSREALANPASQHGYASQHHAGSDSEGTGAFPEPRDGCGDADMADAACELRERRGFRPEQDRSAEPANDGEDVADANCAQREGMRGIVGVQQKHPDACGASVWWKRDPADEPESGVGRVANGVANRVDRLRAAGNGQVSIVAAKAWELLA